MDITRLPVEIQRMIAQRATEEDNAFMAGTSRHMQDVFGAENDRRVSQRARMQGPLYQTPWHALRERFSEDGVTAGDIVQLLEELLPPLLRPGAVLEDYAGPPVDRLCLGTIALIGMLVTPDVPPSSGRWTGHIWRYINAVRRITRMTYNHEKLVTGVRGRLEQCSDNRRFSREDPHDLSHIEAYGRTVTRRAALLKYLCFPDYMRALDEAQD